MLKGLFFVLLQFSVLYFVAFALVIIGVTIYNLRPTPVARGNDYGRLEEDSVQSTSWQQSEQWSLTQLKKCQWCHFYYKVAPRSLDKSSGSTKSPDRSHRRQLLISRAVPACTQSLINSTLLRQRSELKIESWSIWQLILLQPSSDWWIR